MRRLKLTTLLVLPLAFALTLGTSPQPAEAGLCKQLNKSKGCVRSGDVKNDNLKAKDLRDEAGVEFTNAPGNGVSKDLSSSWSNLDSLEVTHPASGLVTCIGMGFVDWDSTTFTGNIRAGWTTEGPTAEPPFRNVLNLPGGQDGSTFVPLHAMRTFSVTGAGTITFFFNGIADGAGATEMDYGFHSTACMYHSTRY